MKTTVYCKTVAKGRQAFFVEADGKRYFLFEQAYRVSNRNYFGNGVYLAERVNYENIHSESVKLTLEKIPSYIRYIENEYGIAIYEKTKARLANHGKPDKKAYKREKFRWDYGMDYSYDSDEEHEAA